MKVGLGTMMGSRVDKGKLDRKRDKVENAEKGDGGDFERSDDDSGNGDGGDCNFF